MPLTDKGFDTNIEPKDYFNNGTRLEDTMENNVETLYVLMDKQLCKIDVPEQYRSIEMFIDSDDTCVSFIQYILHDDEFIEPESGSAIYKFAKTRARHSVITFLMGLVFAEFAGITQEISNCVGQLSGQTNAKSNTYLKAWMITSLYHDKGYYSKYLGNYQLDYTKVFRHYLLTDHYDAKELYCLNDFAINHSCFFAHSYDQITCYDQYARGYHSRKKGSIERLDHGILGGILVFNDLVRKALKAKKNDIDFLLAKACCISIAQHNIFKSSSSAKDKEYPNELSYLYHDSPFRIQEDTPLLLFLCLVDTLECVKKFSKEENDKSSLQTRTVLSSIALTINKDEICINLSELRKRIEDKKNPAFSETYTNYRDGIKGLHTWTAFKATPLNEDSDIILLTLPKEPALYGKELALVSGV